MATASAARCSTRQLTSLGRRTALILAASVGQTLVVEQLIATGAARDVQDNEGYGPGGDCNGITRVPSITDRRRLGRDTALCCAARGGHSATISALVFAGADEGVSNNNGYGKHRGSAWMQSSKACGLGRETADELAEEAGMLAEYEAAVRKVRRVQPLTGRP